MQMFLLFKSIMFQLRVIFKNSVTKTIDSSWSKALETTMSKRVIEAVTRLINEIIETTVKASYHAVLPELDNSELQ